MCKMSLVPPYWIVEPRDVTVLAGQPLMVHCQADGYPKPNVTWSRTFGTILIEFYSIISLDSFIFFSFWMTRAQIRIRRARC